jgi:hypothetical protein
MDVDIGSSATGVWQYYEFGGRAGGVGGVGGWFAGSEFGESS